MLCCCSFHSNCWQRSMWFVWRSTPSHHLCDCSETVALGEMVNIRKMKQTRHSWVIRMDFGGLLLYYWSVRERMGHQGWNNSFWCAVNGWILALKWCLIPLFEAFTTMNTNLIILALWEEFYSLHVRAKCLLHFNQCTPPIKVCINRALIRIDFHY